MSVMTPEQLRNGGSGVDMNGRPIQPLQLAQPGLQTEALRAQLAGQPVAPNPGTFARGGQVKQLPSSGVGGTLTDLGISTGAEMAGKQLATAAAKGAVSTGVKSALTSGAGGAAAGMGIGIGTGLLANKLRVKEDAIQSGGPNGAYLDSYGRRMEDTGGGTHSNAIKYAGMVANPALTASTMGLNLAAGAAYGAIKAAVNRHAKSAYTDFRVEDGAQGIKDAYKGELGREATDDEVMTHLKNVGFDPTGGDRWAGEKSTNFIIDQIRASPEAQAFRASQGGAPGAAAAGAAPDTSDPFYTGTYGQPPATATTALQSRLAGAGSQPTASTGLESRGAETAAQGAPQTGQAATTTAPAEWDTDGYAAPAYTAPAAGAVPDGWDATKWNDPNNQHPKYAVGRILSQFPPTVDGLAAAFPEIEKAYPGATFNGKDKISIPGVGTNIDVLKGASNGGEAWRWDGGDEERGSDEGTASPTGSPSLIDASGGKSNQQDVMALIAQLVGREGQHDAGGLTQALMNQLRATA